MKFILIAGPCVIESKEQVFETASEMKNITDHFDIDYYFKASFDKANRTSVHSYRGPGLEKGLEVLAQVKERYGLKICTDIHEAWQAQKAAEVADILQIPAFLCRQTGLLSAAAKTGKIIHVKKAQFLAPCDMKYVIEKLRFFGNDNILLCERGTCFGYHSLVVDMTSVPEMKKLAMPVIFDATHSVQQPGANGKESGGRREYVPVLARAAVAAGADGLFLEVHAAPEQALSDGASCMRLSDVRGLLEQVVRIRGVL